MNETYKEFPRESGIYCYENVIDNKKYIGLSINLYNRIKQHETNFEFEDFDRTVGENKYLWNSVNYNGRHNFKVYIIETCEKDILEEREIYWIKELKSHVSENGYNFLWGGFSRLGTHHSEETKNKLSNILKGRSISEETRQKISESNKGKIFSPETKQKMSDSLKGIFAGEKNPNYGKRQENSIWWGKNHSEETKEKISKANRGHIVTKETREKISLSTLGDKHWAFGRKISDEEKDNMSKGMIGKKHGKGTSKYKGVSFYKKLGKWKVSITINRKQVYLGVFDLEIDAAKTFDKVCWENYNDLSKLNFPEDYK